MLSVNILAFGASVFRCFDTVDLASLMREGQLTCGKSGYSFLEVSFEAFENPLCLTVIKKTNINTVVIINGSGSSSTTKNVRIIVLNHTVAGALM